MTGGLLSASEPSSRDGAPPSARGAAVESLPAAPSSFQALYDAHVDFVWRSARRLGIPEANLEDVSQDVFVVVHRRLADYDGRASMKSWLFGIVAHVAREHRRRFKRKTAPLVAYDETHDSHAGSASSPAGAPHAAAERSETVRLLYALLDELDDDKREVLVLAQLEEMTIAEIAECLGLNPNTASARLRAARKAFEEAHAKHRARQAWLAAQRGRRT